MRMKPLHPHCRVWQHSCTDQSTPAQACTYLAMQHHPGVLSSPVLPHLLNRYVFAVPLTTCGSSSSTPGPDMSSCEDCKSCRRHDLRPKNVVLPTLLPADKPCADSVHPMQVTPPVNNTKFLKCQHHVHSVRADGNFLQIGKLSLKGTPTPQHRMRIAGMHASPTRAPVRSVFDLVSLSQDT